MRLRNQFLISITVFIIVLAIVASSVALTQLQTAQLNNKETVAMDIQTRASNLAYLSNDYFLYQESSQLTLWQSEFSSLTDDFSKLGISSPEQQTLFNNTKLDAQRLNAVWADVVAYLANAPRNVSVRVLPAFQTDWSRMAVQNQALIFDAQQLSQSVRSQIDQLNLTNIFLILAFLALFGAYFITNYVITYRNTLKSISDLQKGIGVIGSGNLDSPLNEDKGDEISEISKSVNQMVADLKTVTASKTELEREISERKRTEEALEASEENIRHLLQYAPTAIYEIDYNGPRFKSVNDAMCQMTGYSREELLSMNPADLLDSESRIRFQERIRRGFAGDQIGDSVELRAIVKDGRELWIVLNVRPTYKEGKLDSALVVGHDITERKKSEEILKERTLELSETRDYLDNLLNHANAPIIVWNPEFKITMFNHAFEHLTNLSASDVKGKSLDILFPEDKKKNAMTHIRDTLAGEFLESVEIPILRKDGAERIILWNSANIYGPNSKKIVATIAQGQDITERKKAEEQATDAERFAAIGRTAAMVGHDLRNPLQAIVGHVGLAEEQLERMNCPSEEKKTFRATLKKLTDMAFYMNKIVSDLQDYARPLNLMPITTDLSKLIEETLSTCKIPPGVSVSVLMPKNFPSVALDSSVIRRVLTNLVTNAAQAMPEGGKLTVRVSEKKDPQRIRMSVEDTGVGMTKEARQQVFTPLFTTKSKGQGFGLAVCKRLVEAHGGTITFRSQFGKGTKFTVQIPLDEEEKVGSR